MFHETRLNVTHYIYKRITYYGHAFYAAETWENQIRLHNSEPSQYAEKVLDQHQINWYIQNIDIFFPKYKSIFVDKRDEDLFK